MADSPLTAVTFIYSLAALALILLIPVSAAALVTTANINMVEGHSVHRIASRFRTKLVGRKYAASSPNGRFADGAAAIDGRVLSRMEAVGKNLFAFFSDDNATTDNGSGSVSGAEDDDVVVVHVHFGMSGVWAVHRNAPADEEPEVKPTTRLRLEEILSENKSAKRRATGDKFITHLSAMTVAHGDLSLYSAKKAALGQDPLRPDADPDILYSKIAKSKKSIGKLLMDQSCFAGPGNIYRAEILFLAGVYPTTLGMCLGRESFDRIWKSSVGLLRRGYDTGSILTVDAATDPGVAARGERRYIYNKSKCARCGSRVSSWDMAGRTCYACEGGGCQPKIITESDGNVDIKVVKKKGKVQKGNNHVTGGKGKIKDEKHEPQQHVPFISHCARTSYRQRLEQGGAERLTIVEIRIVMEQIIIAGDVNGSSPDNAVKNLPPKSARKAVHVEALNNLLLQQQQQKQKQQCRTVVKKEETTASFEPLPPPVVSSEDAAREKSNSGENRAVEHVAELSREQTIKAISVMSSHVAEAAGDSKAKHSNSKKNSKGKRRGSRTTAKNGRVRRTVKEEGKATSSKPLPPPVVSAEDAAREKADSGENRAVEHVAELSRMQAIKATSLTPTPAATAVATGESKIKGCNSKKKGKRKRGGDKTPAKNEKEGNRRTSRRRLNYAD